MPNRFGFLADKQPFYVEIRIFVSNNLTKMKHMKKLLALSFVAALFVACSSNPKPTDETTANTETAVEVTVGNFTEKAPELVGQLVTIKGTADHICKGDGKKLFLIDIETEGRVKVVTGEDMPAFNSELEGYDFIVTGTVDETVIDEAYLQEWEEEIKAGIEESKHLGGGQPLTEEEKAAGEHHDEDPFEQITDYRAMMANQGVTKLSFYAITAVSYEVIEE